MDRRHFVKLVTSTGALAGGLSGPLVALGQLAGEPQTFVTIDRDGQLRRGSLIFRYIGANMPEVTHIRTDWDLEQANRFRLPTTDEIDWIVETAAQANFKVIRTWCFPSHLQPELPPHLHYFSLKPDGRTVKLNELAFGLFDYFIMRCGELNVLAQVPFVYLYKARQWANASGDPHPQLLDLVDKVVGRINTRTGIAYKDDPTIFAWESGNEARPSAKWIAALATFVKRVAPKQLFVDGRWGTSDVHDSYADAVLAANRDVDIVSVHTYEKRPKGWSTPEAIARLSEMMRAQGRALDVGEIGPGTSTSELSDILGAVIKESVAGASWWSFKGARAKGGYTHWNGKEWGGNDDLKWPGFVSSLEGVSTEKAKLDLLCGAAYVLEEKRRPPRLPRPTPAKLLPIRNTGHISWIPGTGEQVADVQRSTRADGGFVTIVSGFETFKGSTFDLFCDTSAAPERSYYYRVRSRNTGGAAMWSNVVGPVTATSRWLVDDFWDLDKIHARSARIAIESSYDLVPFHSDLSVLTASSAGQHITYRVSGRVRSVLVISNNDTATVALDVSVDGKSFREIDAERQVFKPLHAEFGGHPRVRYRSTVASGGDPSFLRIRFGAGDVISRLEIESGA